MKTDMYCSLGIALNYNAILGNGERKIFQCLSICLRSVTLLLHPQRRLHLYCSEDILLVMSLGMKHKRPVAYKSKTFNEGALYRAMSNIMIMNTPRTAIWLRFRYVLTDLKRKRRISLRYRLPFVLLHPLYVADVENRHKLWFTLFTIEHLFQYLHRLEESES